LGAKKKNSKKAKEGASRARRTKAGGAEWVKLGRWGKTGLNSSLVNRTKPEVVSGKKKVS